MKRCTRCGIEKPLTAFQADSRRKDGRKARCKSCVRGRTPAGIDLRGWLGLPEEASVSVEASLPYNMKPAAYVLALVRRDANARWSWDHVKNNGDYWCLSLKVEIDGVLVEMPWLSHWTRAESLVLDAELQTARGEETAAIRLPPAPMAYAGALGSSSKAGPS